MHVCCGITVVLIVVGNMCLRIIQDTYQHGEWPSRLRPVACTVLGDHPEHTAPNAVIDPAWPVLYFMSHRGQHDDGTFTVYIIMLRVYVYIIACVCVYHCVCMCVCMCVFVSSDPC